MRFNRSVSRVPCISILLCYYNTLDKASFSFTSQVLLQHRPLIVSVVNAFSKVKWTGWIKTSADTVLLMIVSGGEMICFLTGHPATMQLLLLLACWPCIAILHSSKQAVVVFFIKWICPSKTLKPNPPECFSAPSSKIAFSPSCSISLFFWLGIECCSHQIWQPCGLCMGRSGPCTGKHPWHKADL